MPPNFRLESIFVRAQGASLGRVAGDPAEVLRIARELSAASTKLRLHVWERDRYRPNEEPTGYLPGNWAESARHEILAFDQRQPLGEQLFGQGETADPGDVILDVVVLSPPTDDKPGEWWLGTHEFDPRQSPFVTGRPWRAIPIEAPSRAYAKIAEAVAWADLPIRAGDQAVEVGSAPGGASYFLRERGLRVVGIDPGQMAPIFSRSPLADGFTHIPRKIADVPRESLPGRIDWLLIDMNVAPGMAVTTADRLATRMQDTLLGMVLTLKLNQWKTASEIPSLLDHVRAIGMVQVRALQLPSNRQEFCVVALTRQGALRKNTPKPAAQLP